METVMQLNTNRPVPLLFVGDGESLTGLSRIGHDLAWLASSMPEFKVGYLGRQSVGRSRLPWAQYSFPAQAQWGEQFLEQAWNDLAGQEKGIIFTVWDASRLLWFADARETGRIEEFLRSGRFQRWGYFMADGGGCDPTRLPLEQQHVLGCYQRVLMASRWAYGLAEGIAGPEVDWLPHPINREVFRPVDRLYARSGWGVRPDEIVIGSVMANQARKHWPVIMEAIACLGQMTNTAPRLWIHTDTMMGYWNLQALAVEYGIAGQVLYEGRGLSDSELAMRYSACDVTVVISGGEGFCYPVAESLSCGTPAVTGSYGAHAELTPWHVQPCYTMVDTNHNVRRAYYDYQEVAKQLGAVLATDREPQGWVDHLDMRKLGLCWKKWFRRGL